MMKILRLFAFFLVICASAYGQEYGDTKTVNVYITYLISSTEGTTKLNLKILVPSDVKHKQTVNSLNFTVEPDRLYEKNGNRYADFTLTHPIPESIGVEANVTIHRSDYKTLSRAVHGVDAETGLERYLGAEPYIDSQSPEIISQAAKLKRKDQIGTVERICAFVTEHVHPGDNESRGSLAALKSGKGYSLESSSLMVALCRANSIPARVVYGMLTDWEKHFWVEVYLDGIGWATYDPTSWSSKRAQAMGPRYVLLCPGGNDRSIMGEYYFYQYNYYGTAPSIKDYYQTE